ncbi:aminoglycoside phosphotransferase family protein [Glycomyces paridis]|uniref:Aminoglycoside phosphotransferase family protein n=1 Tax=Glycomyces paridis TaxID=2126555 RepID=A0A4S8P8A4_9ACTN|nr:aminoglycoside phosphotransferase family protein [Glycomyces paridis]THV26447.1 aminoglycoside phosphotransferase family protein [Glycomyces paridis]
MNDQAIDEDFVRGLLRGQHPDLADLPLRPVEGGWDNQMWRLGDDLAVRLPCTDRAPGLLEKEHRWLPGLAAGLPLPVPVPVRLGVPSDAFPRNWIVTTWVPGEPADRAPISEARSADVLADLFAALHREAPAGAPASPDRGVPLDRLAADMERGIGRFTGDAGPLREVWADALAAPAYDGPPVWLHGDLHPANAVTAGGALTGLIDFGDMCAGDPATDLAAAWVLLPDGAAARCFERYGADAAAVRRARGWALGKALALIEVGHAGDMGWDGGKPTWGPAGRAALDRLLKP